VAANEDRDDGAGRILVFNAGSSSIKFALFDKGFVHELSGLADAIGGDARLVVDGHARGAKFADHATALDAILATLAGNGIRLNGLTAAAHRVVHGGRSLKAPCRLTEESIAEIEACVPLAPLHNPHNLTVIRAVAKAAPSLPQYASFDTAFHTTNPEVALRYAIPEAEDAKGIRRYGFHGISYSGLVREMPRITGAPLPARLLAMHLGNGASLCAIRDGHSAATTMGYSPLDGLTMGTRSGGIDGNAVLRLASENGFEATARLLNRESGLVALGGNSDMRALHASGTPQAEFAIRHFCYWAVRHAGSMIAAMGGIDALVFTGGIGEHDADVRAEIMSGLDWAGLKFDGEANTRKETLLHGKGSSVAAWIIPADEEETLARDAAELIAR
jgi:acetate kinase